MANTFSAARVMARIEQAAVGAVNATAQEAAAIARQRAPVRKVFHGSLGRSGAPSARSAMSLRQLSGPGRLTAGAPLTARGRWELKSGRAAFTGAGSTTLGGRLRGEIFIEPAEGGGSRWQAKVVSPTSYSKFVEFGTRRSRAQPYLRPALANVRASFRQRMVEAARSGRTS